MNRDEMSREIKARYIVQGNHVRSNYFAAILELVRMREASGQDRDYFQSQIDEIYSLVREEILNSEERPKSPVKFGTSGWRGIIGKDFTRKTVSQVTQGIINMYKELDEDSLLAGLLGVKNCSEAKERGCLLGFDNRFGGQVFAEAVCSVLTAEGFKVHFAGESTTGALSAALLESGAAFSCNLTPSHNPLQYAGFKFNGADAGPAPSDITSRIQVKAEINIESGRVPVLNENTSLVSPLDSLAAWKSFVRKGKNLHTLDYDRIVEEFNSRNDLVLAIDCVHGASRVHVRDLLGNPAHGRLIILRGNSDPTFGGVAPEPSVKNMEGVDQALSSRNEKLKLGVIMDPDADRIRFTDGSENIDMNYFGALAYHYLHEIRGVKGMVAKTVATSNFANAIAEQLGEEVFEPKVGFKEFKPVIGKAVVYFEESDGISIKGHTPEKDAFIGLMLALSMTMELNTGLGNYLSQVQERFGHFYAERDGVTVSQKGPELAATLSALSRCTAGTYLKVGGEEKKIRQLIDIDGYKMVLEDGSWILVRASGTEPKVRFYVESRTEKGKKDLFDTARELLKKVGLL